MTAVLVWLMLTYPTRKVCCIAIADACTYEDDVLFNANPNHNTNPNLNPNPNPNPTADPNYP